MSSDRESRENKALVIVRRIHEDRYGFTDVNEDYVRDLSDGELDAILEADRLIRESGY